MKAKNAEKEKPQQWPYVRWLEREESWMVDARTKDGGARKYFKSRDAADTYARNCRLHRGENGTRVFGDVELKKFGWSVQRAIEFALEHLRREEKSVAIEAAIDELIQVRAGAGRSDRYQNDLRLRLDRFAAVFPKRSVASITAKELDEWLAGLCDKDEPTRPLSPGTRNTFRRDLRTLFSFCEKRSYCPSNEAKKTEKAREMDKPAAILTPKQAGALLSACGDDTLPVVAISLFSGLRAAEVEKLDWAEVDLRGKYIEVTAAKSKTARRRLVPISANLAAWLRPLAKKAGAVAPVGLRKRLDAAKERAGFVEWPQNAMRHSYGSYRLADCQDAPRVALEMGNSAAMVFAHYRELVRPKDALAYWKLRPIAGKRITTFPPSGFEQAA
ncbi:MAG: tyrosine-type recombinase/integrase [Chthoniobacter sp.]|uniref:tyrosine-type recombinase/integrase n=1 Tax=Chthoniobacter sp. TaxID=2510640 RepID=UPI0032A29FA7